MTFLLVGGLFALVLFGLAFFAKRRFGVLGLALAAGSMLSTLWVGDVTPMIAQAGIVLVKPPLESVVAALLTVAPALMLLAGGPSHHSAFRRLVGAALFALLAITLLREPLGAALVIDGPGKAAYDFIVTYHTVILTTCLVAAVVDLLVVKTPKIPEKH